VFVTPSSDVQGAESAAMYTTQRALTNAMSTGLSEEDILYKYKRAYPYPTPSFYNLIFIVFISL
jgi:hypothetical protein